MALSLEQIKLVLSAQDDTKPAFNSAGSGMSNLGSSAALLTKALGAIGLGLSVGKLIGDLFEVNKAFQSLQASLVTAAGDKETADAVFGKLQQFAKDTPFQLDQVVTAFIKLKNMGLTPSIEALTSYGNTAGAMGKNLNDMIEAVADAAVGEFERLKEFGIKSKTQGDEISFTFRGVTTTVAKTAEDIEGYLMGLGNVEFAGGMNQQMETLNGGMSNLGDAWDSLLYTIGQAGFNDQATLGVNVLTESLDRLRQAIRQTNDEKLEDLRGELAHTTETLQGAFAGPESLRWAYGIDGLIEYQNELVDQIAELEGVVDAADEKFKEATGSVEKLGAAEQKAADDAKALSDAQAKQGEEIDKAKQKIIDKKEAQIVAKQAELELAGASRETSRETAIATIAAEENAEALKKQTVSAEKAAEQTTKLAIEMEKIASNERIKTIELAVDFNIAKIQADSEIMKSAFDGVAAAVQSTGDLLGSLAGQLGSVNDFSDKWLLEDLIKDEEKRRDDAMDLQKELTQSQIDINSEKLKAMQSGDALIKISGDGLAPELEAFMWKILETIQIRAAEDQSQFLLGV